MYNNEIISLDLTASSNLATVATKKGSSNNFNPKKITVVGIDACARINPRKLDAKSKKSIGKYKSKRNLNLSFNVSDSTESIPSASIDIFKLPIS